MGKEQKEDNYSYKGWLYSDSFVKRALAIWGHWFAAYLLIGLGVVIIVGFVYLLVTIIGRLLNLILVT